MERKLTSLVKVTPYLPVMVLQPLLPLVRQSYRHRQLLAPAGCSVVPHPVLTWQRERREPKLQKREPKQFVIQYCFVRNPLIPPPPTQASTRGTQGTGGKINAALASQPADGGRVKDALVEGSNRAAPPLVVSRCS